MKLIYMKKKSKKSLDDEQSESIILRNIEIAKR